MLVHKIARLICGGLVALLSIVTLPFAGLPCAAGETAIGRKIASFTLPDIHGQPRTLDAGEKIVVVAFLGTECPLARLYAPRLQELSDEYASRGVVFVAIDANDQDTLTEMDAFARQYGLRVPLLKDREQTVTDQFSATRNPIAYVLDREHIVRYQGRIDDQYGLGASSGYARPEIKRRDLGSALDELLAGREVSQPTTPVTGCLIGRKPRVAPRGEVTYSQHIAALLDKHCVSCHRAGEVGPFALTDYEEVVGWAEMLREVVSDGRMPPWSASPEFGHFANDPRLSADERALLSTWIDNGCPQGDPQSAPAPRQWTDGWQIAEPDQVIRVPKPFKVPAEGVVPYQYFLVDPGWQEDKWIQAAEVRPGNRAVVHHILVSVLPRGQLPDPRKPDGLTQLTSYVPGSIPHVYEPGVAIFVPARSRLVINVHYTPNGVAQEDQTALGVVFADPATVKKRALWDLVENRTFKLLPNERDQRFEATYVFGSDQLLLSMSPHMHLRGQSFRYEAQYPDGRKETLLDVPNYDFNWQLRYDLARPLPMPAGTKLVCFASFDNSAENVANPNPGATVTFGWETWEEMMTGFFTSVALHEDVQKEAPRPKRQ